MQNSGTPKDADQGTSANEVAELQAQLRTLRAGDKVMVAAVSSVKKLEDLRTLIEFERNGGANRAHAQAAMGRSANSSSGVSRAVGGQSWRGSGAQGQGGGANDATTPSRTWQTRPQAEQKNAGSARAGDADGQGRSWRTLPQPVLKAAGTFGTEMAAVLSEHQAAFVIERMTTDNERLTKELELCVKGNKDSAIAFKSLEDHHQKALQKISSLEAELETQVKVAVKAEQEAAKEKQATLGAMAELTNLRAEFSAKTAAACEEFTEQRAELKAAEQTIQELKDANQSACESVAALRRSVCHLALMGRPPGFNKAVEDTQPWFFELIAPGLELFDASDRGPLKQYVWYEFCSFGFVADPLSDFDSDVPVGNGLKVQNIPNDLDKAKLSEIIRNGGFSAKCFCKYIPAISEAMHRLDGCRPLSVAIREAGLVSNGFIIDRCTNEHAKSLKVLTEHGCLM